jgi:hypothetical protein
MSSSFAGQGLRSPSLKNYVNLSLSAPYPASASLPEARARCGSSARRDLCGGAGKPAFLTRPKTSRVSFQMQHLKTGASPLPSDGGTSGSQQQMEVVGHQSPYIARGLGFTQDRLQPLEKIVAVGVLPKYLAALDTTADDKVQGTRGIDAASTWHA